MVDSPLREKRAKYSQALERSLGHILEQLISNPQVEKVILFGSYAQGRRDLFTDLDLLVVMVSDQDFVQRTAALYGRLRTEVDMDLLVYTPEEFERMRQSGFVRHVLTTGQTIYEKERTS
jgi:predicted nucleotidyltransferase